MSDTAFSPDRLRGLIGRRVLHRGLVCQVVEILEEGPTLVLRDYESPPTIQPDQFGEAHRLVPRSVILPVWAGAGNLSPEFLELDLLDEH